MLKINKINYLQNLIKCIIIFSELFSEKLKYIPKNKIILGKYLFVI